MDNNVGDLGNQTILNKIVSDNIEFSLNLDDTILTLTRNNSFYKENITNFISKMVIIRELRYVNLNDLSMILAHMKIEKLNIFYVNSYSKLDTINYMVVNKGCLITYAEMKPEQFITFLNKENNNFLDYNKHTMYIVKGGNYINIKNLFAIINGYQINLGRGGSQKAHVLSPLDFRLSCYLMAMFNFDYKYVSYLNTFNDLDKDRYLPYEDKSHRFTTTSR